MHLKKLTLCLFGLGLSACSSHVVKNNGLNQNTTQRAIQSFNALYEYPSFDYRGQLKFQLNTAQNHQSKTDDQTQELDTVVEKKINQYLKDQKISLTKSQKNDLYQALAKQDVPYLRDVVGKGSDFVQRMLNDLHIQYDGSVNYRQKLASFNLETQYNKPNLAVKVRVPTILDLNNHRIYTHIFSLMPYLSNTQDQDKYAYFDFSKYKNDIAKLNGKAFIEFLKQSGATSYLLASPDQIENLSVSTTERQAGISEKIRLNSTMEELSLQGHLYTSMNRQYFMNSVLGLSQENMAKISASSGESEEELSDEVVDAAQAAMESASADNDASSAMYKLYEAVNRTIQQDQVEAAEESVQASDEDSDQIAQDDVNIAEEAEVDAASSDASYAQQNLTEQQCENLSKHKSKARFGDVEYCKYSYDVDILANNGTSSVDLAASRLQKQNKAELAEKFGAYGKKDQLIDAEQFKQFWQQHQTEIEASLPPKNQRNPLIVDLSLDEQGRLAKADYDLGISFDKQQRKLNVKMDMQVLNYGNAHPIDRKILKDAKSFNEIFKGSIVEQAVGGLLRSSSEAEQQDLSLDEHYQQLAELVYQQTGSYEKTYKAVFIARLTAEKPELIKQYSAQDLQEIAAVYAYIYSDEDVYNLTGQALKHIEALKDKHHLQDDDQYDDDLGNEVDRIVTEMIEDKQYIIEIQKLAKTYKTAEAVFAQYYKQEFEAENEVEKDQRAEFNKTAQILAKSYTAFKNKKFTDAIVANLNENSAEFIDYELFKQSYQRISDAKLK